jgi:hypothetical protein
MAEGFVRTIKRDYVPDPMASPCVRQLPSWIDQYNQVHPRKALGFVCRESSLQLTKNRDRVSGRSGLQHPDSHC